MRTLSALPLDDDILDRILTFCPTFITLQSTILVSKAFYNVFQTHPKSITRAVAYNLVGPALPQALRVVRYSYVDREGTDPLEAKKAAELPPDEVAGECPEDPTPGFITASETVKLQDISAILEELENVYSLTQKDRSSRTSVLTHDQSFRFRRALLRFWLFTNIFKVDRYVLEDLETEAPDEDVKRIQAQRAAVLNVYPTDELREIWAAVQFVRGLYEAMDDGHELYSLGVTFDVLVACGPRGALHAWSQRRLDAVEDLFDLLLLDIGDMDDRGLHEGFFDVPVRRVWADRGVSAPEDECPRSTVAPVWKPPPRLPGPVIFGPAEITDEKERVYEAARNIILVDGVVGARDACSQCASQRGVSLLCHANWHHLNVHPSQFLKSRLHDNDAETEAVEMATADITGTDEIAEWLEGLLSFREGPYSSWTADLEYCTPCLTRFLDDHVWKWWLAERTEDGSVLPDNCPDGYDCRNLYNGPHAEEKNHLCVPTKEE
ncbi:hypothetical protein B0H16DRAFT_1583089 [Mycena metata]|uniref:F-box domain-containing protein n=1 Tax=Mycena metata TaxID=1033252 RepID=A0AAD7HZF3_9AGAR|nr:hypothetical protein B0H16DRAFT_1583089 [Mycena metata]